MLWTNLCYICYFIWYYKNNVLFLHFPGHSLIAWPWFTFCKVSLFFGSLVSLPFWFVIFLIFQSLLYVSGLRFLFKTSCDIDCQELLCKKNNLSAKCERFLTVTYVSKLSSHSKTLIYTQITFLKVLRLFHRKASPVLQK